MASEMKSVYDFSQHSVLSTALLIADRKASNIEHMLVLQ